MVEIARARGLVLSVWYGDRRRRAGEISPRSILVNGCESRHCVLTCRLKESMISEFAIVLRYLHTD